MDDAFSMAGQDRAAVTDSDRQGTDHATALRVGPAEFSHSFLAGLAFASLEHQRRSGERLDISRPRNLALILALSPEVVRLAVLSAVCASVANAIVAPAEKVRKPPSGRLLLRFYPSESSRYILAASRLRRSMPSSAAAARLDELHETIAEAHAATIAFAAAAYDVKDDAATAARLTTGWQGACRVVLHLLEELGQELEEFRIAAPASITAELKAAVMGAAQGGTPFLDAAGEVQLPAWAELRRSVRLPVNSLATMSWHGRDEIVRLTNISTGGAGVICDAALEPGDAVVIVVDPSIVMPGRVAWRNGRNAGITFDQPFYDDSPELKFLARVGEAVATE